jgi:hypothetical protein
MAEVNPVAKTPSGCYLIARIVNGTFQRQGDPPTTGGTQGFCCDRPYFYAKQRCGRRSRHVPNPRSRGRT